MPFFTYTHIAVLTTSQRTQGETKLSHRWRTRRHRAWFGSRRKGGRVAHRPRPRPRPKLPPRQRPHLRHFSSLIRPYRRRRHRRGNSPSWTAVAIARSSTMSSFRPAFGQLYRASAPFVTTLVLTRAFRVVYLTVQRCRKPIIPRNNNCNGPNVPLVSHSTLQW